MKSFLPKLGNIGKWVTHTWFVWPLAVIGVLLIGVGIGRFAFPLTSPNPAPVILPSVNPTGAAGAISVPDLIGLSANEARVVVRDLGLPVETIVTKTTPNAAQPGTVITQQPSPGPTWGPGQKITLELAAPATMPDLVAKPAAEAMDALTKLGATVGVEERVAPTAAGAVLETRPAKGAALPQKVTIVVSSAGVGMYLAQLKPIDTDGCYAQTGVVINGKNYTASLVCRAPSPTRRPVPIGGLYPLGKHAMVLRGTVGLVDNQTATSATVRITGDGRVLWTKPVKVGSPQPFRLDVTGVLKLQVDVVGPQGVTIALGDATVLGTQSEIDLLQQQSGAT